MDDDSKFLYSITDLDYIEANIEESEFDVNYEKTINMFEYIGVVDDDMWFSIPPPLDPPLPPPVLCPVPKTRIAHVGPVCNPLPESKPRVIEHINHYFPEMLINYPPFIVFDNNQDSDVASCIKMGFEEAFVGIQYILKRWAGLSFRHLDQEKLMRIGRFTNGMLTDSLKANDVLSLTNVIELSHFCFCVLCP